MKIIILFILLSATPLFAAQYKADVIDIIDGDTVIISTKSGTKTVHIGGFEAPEPGQPFFEESKRLTKETIGDRPVTVKDINIKKNLVEITPASYRRVRLIQISKGYGWVAEPVRPQEKEMEAKARMKRIGVWSISNPESPWAYRKRNGRSPEIGIRIGRDHQPKNVLKNLYGDSVADIQRDKDGSAIGEGGGIAYSNSSVPFSYGSNGDGYWETKTRYNDNNIKQDCQDKWGADYRMANYCIRKQTSAKNTLKRTENKDMGILQYCEEKWGEDWAMVKHCYGQQKTAKRQIERY